MADLRPLARTSVVDAAFKAIREGILFGTFQAGEKLPTESALSKALGVGRSTIREALNRLASSRLILIQHGGAKIVLDYREHVGLELLPALILRPDGTVDLDVGRSLLEMRTALVVDAARLAAERRTDAELAAIREAAEVMQGKLALDLLVEGSIGFWRTVLDASHNLAYRLALNSVRATPAGDVGLFRQLLSPELRAGSHYVAVADAIAAQDARGAHDAARALVDLGANSIYAAMAAAGGGQP
jgi:DNA-binding FadR family transcriptional regulator